TPGRGALLTLIAAVTLKARPNVEAPRTASDWIAESYYRQSKADLPGALEAAQHATEIDPSFGFAWTRVAELQFSFGRIPQSKEALEKGLSLSSRNPAAHSLRGFLFSAENNWTHEIRLRGFTRPSKISRTAGSMKPCAIWKNRSS